jgi:CDP-glucose 4,6-dehydratase
VARVSASGRYAGTPVLLTGAQGFIGSWLARRLLDAGAEVVVPARDGRRFDSRCVVFDADIVDVPAMRRLVDAHGVRAVFHLAAQSTLGVARRDPLATFDVNVRGTYSVLDACRTARVPVERVVVASSYLHSNDPYVASKACAEVVSRSYAQAWGLPVAVLRLANVYGGGDHNFTRLVPETARALVRRESPVLRSDGTPERDFLYVEDAVDAYLAVASSLDNPDARARVWTAGSGDPVAVLDVVRRLISVAGNGVEPVVQGRSTPGELDRETVDASALRDELGWRPRWQLDRGLAETYRWYSSELA